MVRDKICDFSHFECKVWRSVLRSADACYAASNTQNHQVNQPDQPEGVKIRRGEVGLRLLDL